MGARSGNNYLSTLKKLGAEVWFEGERISNVTSHPVLGTLARSIASLYDLQMEKPEAMTFRTSDGGRAGMSFIQPRSADEVRKRGRMMKIWADYGCGTMRDTPDVANVVVAAMAAASGFFSESDRRHGVHIADYYREASDRDWCICLALQGADVSVIEPGALGEGQPLRIVERTDAGLIVDGRCWAGSLLPSSEELLVLPSRASRQEEAAAFACAFAVPSNTKGLKVIAGKSPSRLAGLNCIASFEGVAVPWHRVFLFRDVDRARVLTRTTGAVAHSAHQSAVRSWAKGEFLAGLAALIAEAASIFSDQSVRARIDEMAETAAELRAEVQRAEAEATPDRWGVFAPAPGAFERCTVLSARLQSRVIDIVRLTRRSTGTLPSSAEDPRGAELEAALEIVRDSMGSTHDASACPASLRPIIERVRGFIARLD